jgi:hypothetical protein
VSESIQALVQKHLGDISDAMSPLQLLNQTLDRASMTDVQSGTMEGEAITGADVTRWRSAIEDAQGDEAGWNVAEQIRADILAYRVGSDPFQTGGVFAGTSFGEATKAASTSETLIDGEYSGTERMGAGGDIAARWIQQGNLHQSNLGVTAQGLRVADAEDDEDDGASTRLKMQQAFFGALRGAGLDRETINSLWLWAEAQMQNDPSMSAERLLIGMYDSEAFVKRFPGISQMAQGDRDIPTPGEYIAMEKHVSQELKRVGMKKEGAAFDTLITSLFVNSVSGDEVTERLNAAEQVMYNMPQEVRDTFDHYFGEAGTTISMETFLDPLDEWANVKDDISTARTGAWGQMVAGLDQGWDKDLAKKVSDLGLSQAQQWSRFAEMKESEMLFEEKLNEKVDLGMDDEGVKAAFDMDADLSQTLDRRAAERSAEFRGGGSAMVVGTQTGFGAANA